MSISKADILNPDSGNAAVKLALAETHIINETKSFFESHGVVLSAFSARQQRSDTIVLVKNIPYGTSADTLRTMFGTHGDLRRVLVPPAGTLAVVEFEHAADARNAFRSLAYRRLGNSVMYLEKAPLGMLTEDATPDASPKPAVVATAVAPIKAPLSVDAVGDSATDEAEPQLSAGTTLFVKNLAFSTSNEGLVQALRHLPGFAFARVQTKADAARPGVRLSAGYGFAGFKSKDEAKRALKALEGVVLDGHVLTVRWAGRGAEEETEAKGEGKARSAKMIVKNVPFEATKKDIQELFGCVWRLVRRVAWQLESDVLCYLPVHTHSSSLSASRANSITVRAASPSSSLSRRTRPRAHIRRSGTRICSDGTSSWSGLKTARRISKSCARRRASVSAAARICLAGRGSWTWVLRKGMMLRSYESILVGMDCYRRRSLPDNGTYTLLWLCSASRSTTGMSNQYYRKTGTSIFAWCSAKRRWLYATGRLHTHMLRRRGSHS